MEDVLVDEVELEEVEVDKVLEDEVGVEVLVVLLLLAIDEGPEAEDVLLNVVG